MKEFEKCIQECKYDMKYCTFQEGVEFGWKAALRWVKSHSQSAKNLYMIDVNELEEELKDE